MMAGKATQESGLTQEDILTDPELGRLIIRVNPRARRIIFRPREDGMHVSTPPGTSLHTLREAIEKLRPRLRKANEKQLQRHKPIDLEFKIETGLFKLTLSRGSGKQFFSRSQAGETEIVCPPDTDFNDDKLQEWLRKVVEEALRKQAKILLPPRLQALALRHGMTYRSTRINSSNSRWGSCSTGGNINLSYHLLLLPPHLVDYVLLHELAHTREMNHGERFWALLNRMTGNQAQALRKELKQYVTGF